MIIRADDTLTVDEAISRTTDPGAEYDVPTKAIDQHTWGPAGRL